MEEKNKSNKGLVVLVILMFLVIIGLIGYICYDKGVFDELLGKDKPEQEKLITGNTFRLADVNCEGADVCEKTIKLSYNDANHNVKLVKKLINEKEYSVEVYIDNQLVDTLDGGEFYDWGYDEEKPADLIKDLDGYIYVIDAKYLAIIYPKESVKTNWFLKFYNDTKPHQSDKDIMVTRSGGAIAIGDKDLTSIDSLEFDGNAIKYWANYLLIKN